MDLELCNPEKKRLHEGSRIPARLFTVVIHRILTIWFPFPEHGEEMIFNCISKDLGWKIRKNFQMLQVIKY